LLFGERTPTMLANFYAAATVLIATAGFMAGGGIIFAVGIVAFAAHLAWQVSRLDIDDPAHCLALFKSNRDAGLILFAAMLLDAVVCSSVRCEPVWCRLGRSRRARRLRLLFLGKN